MKKTTRATILLLLHQPFRVTDPKHYPINSLSELFEGKYNKRGYESSNELIFKRVANNSYIPTARFYHKILQQKPNAHFNFTFSGLMLEQCELYPEVGKQVIEEFQKLIATGRVGIAGDNYYHSLVHMLSLKDLAIHMDLQRQKIKQLFGIEPTMYRNSENMFNNEIAEVARLLGYQSMSCPDISVNQKFNDIYGNSRIQIPTKFDPEVIKTCLELNPNKIIHPHISITPMHLSVTETIFNIKNFDKIKDDLQEYQDNNHREFDMLYNDFEAIGEHNSDEDDVYNKFEKWLDFLDANNYQLISVDDAPKYTTDQQKYDVPYDLASANDEQSLISWRGNYLQEMAHLKLVELSKLIEPLRSDKSERGKELLNAYYRLTTTDHYYYLADLPGQMGEFHEMFSPYNSRQDAFEAISFAIDFVTKEIQDYFEKIS